MFRTFIETDSLERASSGAIWGNVWHEMDGMHFPHGGWNDMIVPYVTALAEGVCEALSGGKAEVDFFDGPLGVEMLPVGPRIRIVAIVPEGSPGLAPCCTGRADLAADVLKQGNCCSTPVSSGAGALTTMFADWDSFWGGCAKTSRRYEPGQPSAAAARGTAPPGRDAYSSSPAHNRRSTFPHRWA